MSEQSFNIILTGYGAGKGKYYIEDDLAKMFNIERRQARLLLESCPKTIKFDLDEATAKRYVNAIEEAGARCELEDKRFDLSKFTID